MKKAAPLLLLLFVFFIIQTNAQTGPHDTITFETSAPDIHILNTTGNLWQIGKPQKSFFDSAYTGTNAILTDTINSYPANDTSSFVLTIRNTYTTSCKTCMAFWHKYDMDTIGDKGIIEGSYDGGNSWVELNDTFTISSSSSMFSWNNDVHQINGNYTTHEPIIKGKSDGWIQSSFCWQWYIPVRVDTVVLNPDSLLIRFTFISDSVIKNKEGWMIDNIVSSAADWSECSGIKENSRETDFSVFPNPFSLQAIVKPTVPLKKAVVTVYNSFGQTVKQMNDISGETTVVSRDNLPAGLYFISIREKNKIYTTQKLLITDSGNY
jgi:hypothetical protein